MGKGQLTERERLKQVARNLRIVSVTRVNLGEYRRYHFSNGASITAVRRVNGGAVMYRSPIIHITAELNRKTAATVLNTARRNTPNWKDMRRG